MKTAITPGRLYWLLAREFHEKRSEQCTACRMPLPELVETRGEEECNWTTGTMLPMCDKCAPLIQEIVLRHQAAYDILDPVSRPLRRPGPDAPSTGAVVH